MSQSRTNRQSDPDLWNPLFLRRWSLLSSAMKRSTAKKKNYDHRVNRHLNCEICQQKQLMGMSQWWLLSHRYLRDDAFRSRFEMSGRIVFLNRFSNGGSRCLSKRGQYRQGNGHSELLCYAMLFPWLGHQSPEYADSQHGCLLGSNALNDELLPVVVELERLAVGIERIGWNNDKR